MGVIHTMSILNNEQENRKKKTAKVFSNIDVLYEAMLDMLYSIHSGSNEERKELTNLFFRHTFVAGGYIRDSLLDKPVDEINDVDIFFDDYLAAVKFKNTCLKYLDRDMFTLTCNLNLDFGRIENFPRVSVITGTALDPTRLDVSFDFSFNCCSYKPSTGEFSINKKVFSKSGIYLFGASGSPFKALFRFNRFKDEGWDIPDSSLFSIIEEIPRYIRDTPENLSSRELLLRDITNSVSEGGDASRARLLGIHDTNEHEYLEQESSAVTLSQEEPNMARNDWTQMLRTPAGFGSGTLTGNSTSLWSSLF